MSFLKRRCAPWLALLLLACTAPGASAQEESAVRAAMIFNLLKFTTWPASLPANAPLHICLIQASDELNAAMKMLNGRSVGNHVLEILVDRSTNAAPACEIIATDAENNAYNPAALARYGLLTIGDSNFIDRGGMIGLVRIENRIRFEINATAMQRAGISLSSKVLQLALRVR